MLGAGDAEATLTGRASWVSDDVPNGVEELDWEGEPEELGADEPACHGAAEPEDELTGCDDGLELTGCDDGLELTGWLVPELDP